MGIFDVFKKKENDKVKISVNDFLPATFQMAVDEISYVQSLLKMNMINCEFESIAANTLAYYFSIWLAYIEKEEQASYNKVKEEMKKSATSILKGNCEKNNLNSEKYIEMFNNSFEDGIIEAKSSIVDDTFYDKGITDKYLVSIVGIQDISNIKNQVQIRILQYWVKAASEGMKKTEII